MREILLAGSLAVHPDQVANLRAVIPSNLGARARAICRGGVAVLQRLIARGSHILEVLLAPSALATDAVEGSRREVLAKLPASLGVNVTGVIGLARVTQGWVALIACVFGASAAGADHQRRGDE